MRATQIQPQVPKQREVVSSLLVVIDSLTELLNRETKALERFQIHELGALVNKKDELSENYESCVTAFRTLNLKTGEIEPNLLKQLQDKTRQLYQASEKNKIAVHVAQTMNQKLLQSIMSALEDQNELNIYGEDGGNKSSAAKHSKSHLSLINQKA